MSGDMKLREAFRPPARDERPARPVNNPDYVPVRLLRGSAAKAGAGFPSDDVDKVDKEARAVEAQRHRQSTRALMSGSSHASLRLDSTAQSYLAQHGELSPEKKKQKELEELAKAARETDEWIRQLDELIETLREEAQEHYRKAQELYGEAEDLDDLVKAMQDGDPLTEKQQQKLDEMRKKYPETDDDMLLIIIQQDLIGMRGLAEDEYQKAEKINQQINRIKSEAEKVKNLSPEERDAWLAAEGEKDDNCTLDKAGEGMERGVERDQINQKVGRDKLAGDEANGSKSINEGMESFSFDDLSLPLPPLTGMG